MRTRDEDAEAALEWIGGNPRLVRTGRVPAASDHGCLNALTAGAGDALDVVYGDGIAIIVPIMAARVTLKAGDGWTGAARAPRPAEADRIDRTVTVAMLDAGSTGGGVLAVEKIERGVSLKPSRSALLLAPSST